MKKIIILSIYLFVFSNISAQKYTKKYIKDANKIGLEWWNCINNENYEKSYNYLSDLLKEKFSLNLWENQISKLMEEVGDIISRDVVESYFLSEVEGHDDGFYVMISYTVKYSKTKNHIENLLLKQSDQFEWQIFDFDYEFQNLKTDK